MSKFSLLTAVLATLSIPAMADMTLTSDDVQDGAVLSSTQVFNGFGCTGDNLSPQLSWGGAPKNTKSFGITVYDPDAPTGSGWWHWSVFNIPANVNSIETGASMKSMPMGAVENFSDYDAQGFGGACPPQGDKPHRYIIKVHALSVDKLPLDENASSAKIGYYLGAKAIETVEITAIYGR